MSLDVTLPLCYSRYDYIHILKFPDKLVLGSVLGVVSHIQGSEITNN